MHEYHGARRRGVFTPVVLMVLAVFAILGVTYAFTGASSYGQSAQVIYGLRAAMLAQAALEEAQAVVYDKVNIPSRGTSSAAWKAELLAKVQGEVTSNDKVSGPIKANGADGNGWINLLTSGVDKYKALVTDLGNEVELSECKVKFYGFHRIGYNEQGDVYDPTVYYKNDLLDKDVPDFTPNDFIGYYTIRATARSQKQTKSLAVTHDIKIVNVAPIGHEFAFFQMNDMSKDVQFSETDLNQGGKYTVYPRGWGREYMRGPYTVETEGLPGGEGGEGPTLPNSQEMVSPFYLGDTQNARWYGWQLIPTPRAGVPKRAYLVAGREQVRPRTAQTSIGGTTIGVLTNDVPLLNAPGSGYTALGIDPGLYIPENQVWYTGFKDPTGKEFSLVGDTKGKVQDGAGLSTYRGEKFRLVSGDQSKKDSAAYWPIDDLAIGNAGGQRDYAKFIGRVVNNPTANTDDNWYIAPEAQLKIKCHVVRYKHPGINFSDLLHFHQPFNFSYNLALDDSSGTPGGVATQLYALHWEPERTRGILDSVLDGIKSLTPAFMFASPVFLMFNLDPRTFFSGSVPGGPDDFKNIQKRSLPTNYKGVWSRAASRMYKKASRMRSVVEAGKGGGDPIARVLLDGVIWTRELKLDVPIAYTGKGVLGGEPNPDSSTQDAQVTGPVVPARDRGEEWQARGDSDESKRWSTDNYMTLVYSGASPNAVTGSQMITLKMKSVAGKTPLIDATVLSTHGVKPDGGLAVRILGNLILGVVNKSKTPTDGSLVVDYQDHLLGRRKADPVDSMVKDLTNGSWHTMSVSPKVSGYFER